MATFAVLVFGTVIGLVALARIYTDSDSVRQLVARFGVRFADDSAFKMSSARFRPGEGVTIQDFTWTQKDAKGVDREILKGGVEVRIDPRKLAGGRVAVTKMTFPNPALQIHFDKDGRCAAFKFRKASSETTVKDPLEIEMTGGTIQLTFESPSVPTVEFTGVAGRLLYDPNAKVEVRLRGLTHGCVVTLDADLDLQAKQADVKKLAVDGAALGKVLASLPPALKGSLPSGVFALGKANLFGTAAVAWRDDQPKVSGRVTATMEQGGGRPPVRSAHLAGSFDAKTGVLEVLDARLDGADLAASLPLVPEQHRGKIAGPETLYGTLQVAASGKVRTKEKPFGWEGKVAAELTDARWSPPKAPFPITGASASVEVTPVGLTVRRAQATVGPTKVTASGVLPDWDAGHARLKFSAANVPFAKEVRDLLPERERTLWDKFQPEGHVSIAGEAAMNGGKPRFVGRVNLHDNAITYEKFPCRVTNGQGSVLFKPDGRIEFEAAGTFGGGRGKLAGTLADLSPTSEMELTITASDVEFDDDLRRAFEPIKPAAEAIRRLHAVGKGKGVVAVRRREGSRLEQVTADVDLDLRNFRADWFSYPLDRVTGKVKVSPDGVEFEHCVGRTASGATVRMEGWSRRDGTPTDAGDPTGRNHLLLDFYVDDAPLDRTLRAALPADGQAAWDQLRPEGLVSLTARCVQRAGKPPSLAFQFDASQAAVTPTAFPYRLHDVEGPVVLMVRPGQAGGVNEVTWPEGLVARHGDVEWRTPAGSVRVADGAGELHFKALAVKRLPFDDDLKAAVPPTVRSVLTFLSPSVPAERVSLNEFTVKWKAGGGAPAFDVGEGKATFLNADLVPSVGAKNVTGEVTLTGCCNDGPEFEGNVYLHSVTLAGMKATSLQSKIAVKGPKVTFDRLKADFYGGELHGVVQAVTEPTPKYQATLNVMKASLKDYVRQTMNTEMPLNGRVAAHLELWGQGEDAGRLKGRGTMEMHDVDVLRLPILLDQLNFLLMKLPEGRTFDDLHATFSLDGTWLYLSDLTMSSPAFNFGLQPKTTGYVDLATGRLDVNMVSELTRNRLRLPLLTNVTAFHIGGTFGDPQIRPTPLSGLQKMLTPASRRK